MQCATTYVLPSIRDSNELQTFPVDGSEQLLLHASGACIQVRVMVSDRHNSTAHIQNIYFNIFPIMIYLHWECGTYRILFKIIFTSFSSRVEAMLVPQMLN